jgi:hypothetical protein
MSQLVNQNCAHCGQRISSELKARLCAACGSAVHHDCAEQAKYRSGACHACRTPPAVPAPIAPADPGDAQPLSAWGAELNRGEVSSVDSYEFERTDRGVEFRIPRASARWFARFFAGMVGVTVVILATIATAALLILAGVPADRAGGWATAVGFVAAGLSVAVTHRRLTRTPPQVLLAGTDGGVAFGRRVLVEPGTALRLRVAEMTAGEDTTVFAVFADLRDGRSQQLPVPGLGFWGHKRGFHNPAAAVRFAALIADALGVPVTE